MGGQEVYGPDDRDRSSGGTIPIFTGFRSSNLECRGGVEMIVVNDGLLKILNLLKHAKNEIENEIPMITLSGMDDIKANFEITGDIYEKHSAMARILEKLVLNIRQELVEVMVKLEREFN